MGTETLISRLDLRRKTEPNRLPARPPQPSQTLPDDPRQKKRYYFGNTPLRRVLTPLLTGLFYLFMNLKTEGTDNLPSTGGVVLASNHLTNFDVFPMQIALPRLLFFMGKEELFRNPVLDAALRRFGGFPVYRGGGDEWALQHAREVLERGQVLGIFPEGSRSESRGLRPGKTGAARLALETGSPILPLAISGTQHMFKHFPRRTPVTVRLGTPIYPFPHESPLALTDRLMFLLAEMLPADMRGVYAEHPEGF
jgi:1-acyl-sn-glycerol-3-phosphate acyltransferase